MKCCVSKQIFDGKFPPELVIPNRENNNKPVEATTTSSPRSPAKPPTKRPSINDNKKDQGSCSGTCVTGFFALLCDEIDRTASCPGNGRCCLTKKVDESKPRPTNKPTNSGKCPGFCLPASMSSLCTRPSNILHNTNSCTKGTVCCESGTGSNKIDRIPPPITTKRPPPPPPPRPQRPSGGGGPDLASLLLSAAPSILGAATGNSDAATTASVILPVLGTLLGGGSGPNRNPSPSQGASGPAGLVGSLLPTLVGTFLGGGGGSQNRVPPRVGQGPTSPFGRPPVPTAAPTTTTTTTTEAPDARPDCEGTCIASYLSFTCFGKFFSSLCTLCTPLLWMRIASAEKLYPTSGYEVKCSFLF